MKKPIGPSGPYDVGYGRPPKAHQFRKGRTGNPRGKRRGEENMVSIFKRHVLKRIKITDGDQTRTITLAEAVILKNLNAALQKNPLAMSNIFRLVETCGEFVDLTDPKQVGLPLLVPEKVTIEQFLARHGRSLETE